jgi:hypothetical protein
MSTLMSSTCKLMTNRTETNKSIVLNSFCYEGRPCPGERQCPGMDKSVQANRKVPGAIKKCPGPQTKCCTEATSSKW